MAPLLPVFLPLEGRSCLIVGGGRVAWAKAARLLECGAQVTMVASRIDPPPPLVSEHPDSVHPVSEPSPSEHSLSEHPRIELLARPYRPSDLTGRALVIAATDDPALQRRVSGAAKRRRIPCNVVDVPELCDFVFGAVLRRGDLQIAVSTGGRFPLLAQRLRDRLERWLSTTTAEAVAALGDARTELRRRNRRSPEARQAELARLLSPEMIECVERGDLVPLHEQIQIWSQSLPPEERPASPRGQAGPAS